MWWHTTHAGEWRGNWQMQWVASTLHTTSEHGLSSITTADARTSSASSQLNWCPPADLNGPVHFAERRNLVSARVPLRFKCSLIHETIQCILLIYFLIYLICLVCFTLECIVYISAVGSVCFAKLFWKRQAKRVYEFLLVLWTQYCSLWHNTYSMVQSPSWEVNWFAASQEIPCISRNPKVHYRTHKRPPPFSILGQPNPVHIPTSHLLEIHPNIIHPSTPRSPQWSLSLRLPQENPIHSPLLTHTCHMPSPSHSSQCYHSHSIGWGVQII